MHARWEHFKKWRDSQYHWMIFVEIGLVLLYGVAASPPGANPLLFLLTLAIMLLVFFPFLVLLAALLLGNAGVILAYAVVGWGLLALPFQ